MINLSRLGTPFLITGVSACYAVGVHATANKLARDDARFNVKLPEEKQGKVNELALRMGINSPVIGFQTKDKSSALGSDLLGSLPIIWWDKDYSPFFLAHELSHVKLHHGLKSSFLTSFVGFSTFCFLKPAGRSFLNKQALIAILVGKASSEVFSKMLYIHSFEKQADLMACEYSNKSDIAQAVKLLDKTEGLYQIGAELASPSLWLSFQARMLMAMDPHPSFKNRVAYLKAAYDQKGPPPLLQVKMADQPPLLLDQATSDRLIAMIKESSRSHSLLDLVEIRCYPQSEPDTQKNKLELICSHGVETFDVVPASLPLMMKEALEQPVRHVIEVASEAKKNILEKHIGRFTQLGQDQSRYNSDTKVWEVPVYFKGSPTK